MNNLLSWQWDRFEGAGEKKHIVLAELQVLIKIAGQNVI